MKLRNKIQILGLVIFLLCFISLHVVVNIQGKPLLKQKLEETFKRKVKIGSLTTSFPLDLHVKDVEVEGLFKIDEIFAGGGVFDVFRKNFRLSVLKIIHPVVTIEKSFAVSTTEALVPSGVDLEKKSEEPTRINKEPVSPNLNPMGLPHGTFLSPSFYLRHLIVLNGTLNFIDRTVDKNGIVITLEKLNMKVHNLNLDFTVSQITSFDLKADIPWKDNSDVGKVSLNGWINLFKKDMQADLKIKDIDGVYLYPYYASWVNLEKAHIGKAKLNFNSDIHGLNNEITATCHLELAEMERIPRPEGEDAGRAEKITNMVLDIFKALNQGKIVLDFTVKTKMDSPEFGFSNIKMALQNKIAEGRKASGSITDNVIAFPGKIIEGTVKEAGDVTKSVIGTTFGIGQEFKKAVEDSFRKESASVQQPAPAPSAEVKTEEIK